MTDTSTKIRPPRYSNGVAIQIGDEVLLPDDLLADEHVVVAIWLDQVEVSTGDQVDPADLVLFRRPA